MATRGRVNSALRAVHMPPHLRHLDGKFKNSRGQNLSYLALFPPASTALRAVVVYLHGIGDHSRRYFHLYEHLCNAGFGVLAYDLLSHGASDSDQHGLRAHGAKFHYFVDDTNEFIKMAKTELYPQLAVHTEPKMILSGMSYGTLVSLHTILSGKHEFSAVVLVAPALLVEMTTVLKVQAVFARPLSKLIPKARIVPGVNGDFLCRDQEYIDDFKADPLTVSEPVTARMGAETLKAMRALEADKRVEDKESTLCKLPMLMMMGSNDKVTSLELAQVFYKRLAAEDKEFKVFEEYFHSLFDDPERDAVFDHLDDWLKKRFPHSEEEVAKIDEKDESDEAKEETKTETAEVDASAVAVEEKKAETTETTETKVEVKTQVVEEVKVETTEAVKEAVAIEEVTPELVKTEAAAAEEVKTGTDTNTTMVKDETVETADKTSATDVTQAVAAESAGNLAKTEEKEITGASSDAPNKETADSTTTTPAKE